MGQHPEFPIVNDPSVFGGESNVDEEETEETSVQRSSTEPQEEAAEAAEQPAPAQATSNVGDVESDVPIPTVSRRKYPFDEMAPNDSFEVFTTPAKRQEYGAEGALKRLRSSLSSSATAYCKRVQGSKHRPDVKMVIRKTGDHSLRCWCVLDED